MGIGFFRVLSPDCTISPVVFPPTFRKCGLAQMCHHLSQDRLWRWEESGSVALPVSSFKFSIFQIVSTMLVLLQIATTTTKRARGCYAPRRPVTHKRFESFPLLRFLRIDNPSQDIVFVEARIMEHGTHGICEHPNRSFCYTV